MKRTSLLHHLDRCGARLDRAGRLCSLWVSPVTGNTEAIPRDD